METTKWLPGLICAALLAAGGATSLQIARGAAQREALLRQPPMPVSTTIGSSSSSAPARPASASSDIDLIIKRYYFEHTSEFAPLPASPCERAEALRQIKSTILEKISDVRS